MVFSFKIIEIQMARIHISVEITYVEREKIVNCKSTQKECQLYQ